MANDLEQKIIKQVEYYFGDYNLPKDKFLQSQIKLDDGWIEFDVLLTFKRLASLTKDSTIIAEALKKSSNNIVSVSEDGKKIRRDPNNPLPELTDERKKELTSRTAYAKGFKVDESLDEIIAFLEPYGSIESCSKRVYLDKATQQHCSKPSCFIVFKNLEDCKKFVEAESVKYKDVELVRKMQAAYFEEKGLYQKQHRNKEKLKLKEEKQKATELKINVYKGCIMHFTGIPENTMITREEIAANILEVSKKVAAFIDFYKGDKEGYIRMTSNKEAVEFYDALSEGILEVNDCNLQFKKLEGEEEEAYLKKAAETMMNQKRKPPKFNKNKRNKRKFPRDQDSGPDSKIAKI